MVITDNKTLNYSKKTRLKTNIRFLILHYTGMQSARVSLNRLKNPKSKVSCHYFIERNGKVCRMVEDNKTAWHAGKSKWKNLNMLNKNSVGIEIHNPGHDFKYFPFNRKQILSTIKLCSFLKKKLKINKKNILGHSDISPLRKKDPGEKFPWEYLAKRNVGYWHNIKKNTLIKLRYKKCSKIFKKQFFNNLFKIGYSRIYKNQNEKLLIKAFQRRFRAKLVNGIIDHECLKISKNLI